MQWKLERQRDPKTKTGHRDFFRSSPPNSYEQRAIVMRRNCIERRTKLQADRLMVGSGPVFTTHVADGNFEVALDPL